MYRNFGAELTGLTPLLLHNGQLADPLNDFTRAIKVISKKRNKTDEDYREMAHLEFLGGLYLNEKKQVIIPGIVLEAVITSGAKKSKKGQDSKAGVLVEKDSILVYEGPQGDPEKLWQDKRFVHRGPANVNHSKIMRTRPVFMSWSFKAVVSYDDEVLDRRDVEEALTKAGRVVGLCDWRPRFGRFEVGFSDLD